MNAVSTGYEHPQIGPTGDRSGVRAQHEWRPLRTIERCPAGCLQAYVTGEQIHTIAVAGRGPTAAEPRGDATAPPGGRDRGRRFEPGSDSQQPASTTADGGSLLPQS